MARKAEFAAVLLIALTGTIGCSSGKGKWWQRDNDPPARSTTPLAAEQPQHQQAPAPVATPAPDHQATLSRIEEFLARTQEYEISRMAPPAAVAPDQHHPQQSAHAQHAEVPATAAQLAPPTVGGAVVANQHVAITKQSSPPVVQLVSISKTPSAAKPVAPTQPMRTINTSTTLSRRQEGELTHERIVDFLKDRFKSAKDFDSMWRLRFVPLALGFPAAPIKSSKAGVSQDVDRMITALADAHRAIRNLAGDSLRSGNEALQSVDRLRQVLSDRADPIVESVALCQRVTAFGVYEELPPNSFVAGQSIKAIAYSELRNLRSEPTSDNRFRTLLGTRLEVLTADGTSVWQHESGEIEDKCRRRRQDFFIAQHMTLPPTLSPGDYVLKVFAEDKLSGRASEVAHAFHIFSDGETARANGA